MPSVGGKVPTPVFVTVLLRTETAAKSSAETSIQDQWFQTQRSQRAGAISQKIRVSAGIEERLVILVRRSVFGSPPITGAVGPEPPKPSVVRTLDRPPVLMDEPMVEATDEQKVVEVGGAAP